MDKIRIYIALLFCLTLSFIHPVHAQDTSGSNRYNTQYSYDSMGNITSLSRNGLLDDWSGTGDSPLYRWKKTTPQFKNYINSVIKQYAYE